MFPPPWLICLQFNFHQAQYYCDYLVVCCTNPKDGDDQGAISGMNEWQGKPKYSEKTGPSASLSITDPTWLNPGRRGGKPATNRLTYSKAWSQLLVALLSPCIPSSQGICWFSCSYNIRTDLCPISCNARSALFCCFMALSWVARDTADHSSRKAVLKPVVSKQPESSYRAFCFQRVHASRPTAISQTECRVVRSH
jgi:hypothetical protein